MIAVSIVQTCISTTEGIYMLGAVPTVVGSKNLENLLRELHGQGEHKVSSLKKKSRKTLAGR